MTASVVIPCYNVEKYIYECLDSVKLQGDCVDEIFCVDNNSTDNTEKIIEKWIENNPNQNITLLRELKSSACSARNKPLELIKTEWIQFLDADDLLLENKISFQINNANENDVIYDSYIKRDLEGNEKVIVPSERIEIGIMQSNLGNTCSNLWRTEAILGVGGWNENQASSQEYDLLMRLYKNGKKFKRINNCRTVIRERESGQISQGDQKLIWENYTNLRVSFFNDVIKSFNEKTLEKEALSIIFGATQILYQYNPSLAVKIYETVLKQNDFSPKTTTIKSKIYYITYLIFGFRFAEHLRLNFRKNRSRHA